MNSSNFNFQIIQIDSIESTNIYAQKLLATENVQEGLVIQTNFQVEGKGQQGEKWESEEGKNLLFSIVIMPGLRVEDQFKLSKVVCIGLKNYLDSLSVGEVSIKWPNDILINGKKVAGVLIENSVYGNSIKSAVIGIGLNVNQKKFKPYPRKATSLCIETGKSFNLTRELESVLAHFKQTYFDLKLSKSLIDLKYLESLHGFKTPLNYKDNEGEFRGEILSVFSDGRLHLNRNGKLRSYSLKELVLLE